MAVTGERKMMGFLFFDGVFSLLLKKIDYR